MTSITINSNTPRVQFTATAGQTTFTYNFPIYADTDLKVYARLSTETASDASQLKTLTTDYTVTGAGAAGGGTVVFVVARAAGDVITIFGDSPTQRVANFSTLSVLTSDDLNREFNNLTIFSKQNEAQSTDISPLYNRSESITSKDLLLPRLAASQYWAMNAANTAIQAVTATGGGSDILRAELLSHVSGSDGSLIVGYYDTVAAVGKTVHEKLDSIDTNKTALASEVNGSDGALSVGFYDPATASGKTVNAKLTDIDTNKTALASQVISADGARLVGYYNSITASGTTVQAMISSLASASDKAEKNLITGGDFGINPWQRQVTFTSIANDAYSADCWKYSKVGSMVHDITKDTSAPTVAESNLYSTASLKMECTTAQASLAATDYAVLYQPIEGYDFTRVAQRNCILTFWVYSTLTGTSCVFARNSGKDRSFVKEFTINATNTWERKSIVISASPPAGTWDYTSGVGLEVGFCLGAGANFQGTDDTWNSADNVATASQVNHCNSTSNVFLVDLIRLEEGIVSTQMELHTFDEVLGKCRRYYFKTYNQGVYPGATTEAGQCLTATYSPIPATVYLNQQIVFPVEMRAAPTVSAYSPVTGTVDKVANINATADIAVSSFYGTGSTTSGSALIAFGTADGTLITYHVTADASL